MLTVLESFAPGRLVQLSARLFFNPRACQMLLSLVQPFIRELSMQDQHPSVLEHFEEFAKLLQGKRLAVFLDYDGKHQTTHGPVQLAWCHSPSRLYAAGTLTPIVKDPDRAFMSSQVSCLRMSNSGSTVLHLSKLTTLCPYSVSRGTSAS